MKKELNVKQLQKETGVKIGSKLTKYLQGAKVDVAYVNLDCKEGKGFIFYIYHNDNNYDYKKINVNYVEEIEIIDYVLFILGCLNKNDQNIIEHIATPEEKYISEILESTGIHNIYIWEGLLCNSGYEINLDSIDELKYNKTECTMEIVSDEEKFFIDLVKEEIIFLNEYEPDVEPITIDFIERVIAAWNKLECWCKLTLRDNSIFLIDKEFNTKETNIADIDNMDELSIKNNEVYIGFKKPNKYNFDGCSINKYGIEY